MAGLYIDETFAPSDRAAAAPERERETARHEGRAEDTRWHCRKNGGRFWGNGVCIRLDGPDPPGFLKIVRDETRLKMADEQRILLLNELNHRVKNTLATVQSIAEQTLRAGGVELTVRDNLSRRLQALSQAHDLLVTENWAGAELRAIVETALAPHLHEELRHISFDGPPVRVSPQQAVSISLALHELATNALKHGALSRPEGTVSVNWNTAIDGEGRRYMSLLWTEKGGPTVVEPTRKGFGARLIARTFGPDSGGASRVDYRPEGLTCVIDLPLSQPAEIPILDIRGKAQG
jgi:two-component sensor histidine kinase